MAFVSKENAVAERRGSMPANSSGMYTKTCENNENIESDDVLLLEPVISIASTVFGETKSVIQESVKRDLIVAVLIDASLIFLWYIFSLLLSLYNKWLFGEKHMQFNFPLFATSIHMVGQFLCAALVLAFRPSYRPARDAALGRMEYIKSIVPCGFATGMDIGLSNSSLRTITLAFYSK